MGKRILGLVLFVWMGIATVGAVGDAMRHGGTRSATELAVAVFTGALAALGLVLLFGKSKPPTEPRP